MGHIRGYFHHLVNPTLDKVRATTWLCVRADVFSFHGLFCGLEEMNQVNVLIRSSEAIWWCSSSFFSQDSWTYSSYKAASKYVVCGKCCWIWGLFLTSLTYQVIRIVKLLLILCAVCLFIADIRYTCKNDRDISKFWIYYTRVYIEPTAVWCALFQATLFLLG